MRDFVGRKARPQRRARGRAHRIVAVAAVKSHGTRGEQGADVRNFCGRVLPQQAAVEALGQKDCGVWRLKMLVFLQRDAKNVQRKFGAADAAAKVVNRRRKMTTRALMRPGYGDGHTVTLPRSRIPINQRGQTRRRWGTDGVLVGVPATVSAKSQLSGRRFFSLCALHHGRLHAS